MVVDDPGDARADDADTTAQSTYAKTLGESTMMLQRMVQSNKCGRDR